MNINLVTNQGPVPLVPWGTTWCASQNNTMRRLLNHPGMVLGVGETSAMALASGLDLNFNTKPGHEIPFRVVFYWFMTDSVNNESP